MSSAPFPGASTTMRFSSGLARPRCERSCAQNCSGPTRTEPSLIGLDERSGLIYLRGSVVHFASYPGMYVPRPMEFARIRGETTVGALAQEMTELSKLNSNNTQFDGGEPISVHAARRVGDILKRVPDGAPFQARFGFFM